MDAESTVQGDSGERYAFGDVVVDLAAKTIQQEGVGVRVAPRQRCVLFLLLQHANRVVSMEQLIAAVEENARETSKDRIVDQNVRTAILKLRAQFGKDHFETVQKCGYRIHARRLPPIEPKANESREARTTAELLADYQECVRDSVRFVRLLGQNRKHELQRVFVDLAIVDHRRPGVALPPSLVNILDPARRLKRQTLRFERDLRGGQSRVRPNAAEHGVPGLAPQRPEDLLKPGVHAVITGHPGAGKSTLLRYLAGRSLAESERLVVYLEIKSIKWDGRYGEPSSTFLLEELLLAGRLFPLTTRSEAERQCLREGFRKLCASGRAVVLLDGLDEVAGTTFFTALRQAVDKFVGSPQGRACTLLLTCRPHALHGTRFERLAELEIEPLSEPRVEEFLRHYHPDDSHVDAFIRRLTSETGWTEMATIPMLLSTLFELDKGRAAGAIHSTVEIYAEIVRRLLTVIDSDKPVERRFHVPDTDASFKRLLLERVAASSLCSPAPSVNRLDRYVFDQTALEQCARVLATERRESAIDWFALCADVKQTAIIQEVSVGRYALAHPTIQEYLAARALMTEDPGVVANLAFDHVLAETQVLPLALAMMSRREEVVTLYSELPDSIDRALLRLRLRALAVAPDRYPQTTVATSDEFVEALLAQPAPGLLLQALLGVGGLARDRIIDRLRRLLDRSAEPRLQSVGIAAAAILGATELILPLVNLWPVAGESHEVAQALARIGGAEALRALTNGLENTNGLMRLAAAGALGRMGTDGWRALAARLAVEEDDRVVTSILDTLNRLHPSNTGRLLGEWALDGRIDLLARLSAGAAAAAAAVDTLRTATQRDPAVSERATAALTQIHGEETIELLLEWLTDPDITFDPLAALYLGAASSNLNRREAVLLAARHPSEKVRAKAEACLACMSSSAAAEVPDAEPRAQPPVAGLADIVTGRDAAEALTAIARLEREPAAQAFSALHAGIRSRHAAVRWEAAVALGRRADPQVCRALVEALTPTARDREAAAVALTAGATSPGGRARRSVMDVLQWDAELLTNILDEARAAALRLDERRPSAAFVVGLSPTAVANVLLRERDHPRWELAIDRFLAASDSWSSHNDRWQLLCAGDLSAVTLRLLDRDELTADQALTLLGFQTADAGAAIAMAILWLGFSSGRATAERARRLFRQVPGAPAAAAVIDGLRSADDAFAAWCLESFARRVDAEQIHDPVAELFRQSTQASLGGRSAAVGHIVWLVSTFPAVARAALPAALEHHDPSVSRAAVEVVGYYCRDRETLAVLDRLAATGHADVRAPAAVAVARSRRRLELGRPIAD